MRQQPGLMKILFISLVLIGGLLLGLSVSCNSKQAAPPQATTPSQSSAPSAVPVAQFSVGTSISPLNGGTLSIAAEGRYAAGTELEVSATPAAGFRFDRWEGDATGTNSKVNLSVDSDKHLNALFLQQFTLTAAVDPPGAGTIGPLAGPYDSGSIVMLTAAPAEGYRFDKWSGDAAGQTSELTLMMNSKKDLSAHFVRQVKFSVSFDPPGSGSVTPESASFDAGSKIDVTAKPYSGYMFDHWGDNTANASNPTSILVEADKPLTAHFVPTKIEILTAQSKALIGVTFQGTKYINYVNMNLTSRSDKPYICTIPVGAILASPDIRIMSMVVIAPVEYPLELIKPGALITSKVYVFSLNMFREVPDASMTLNLTTDMVSGDVKSLISSPAFSLNTFSTGQYAIWIISENPISTQGFWPINNTYPTVEQIQKIRDLFKTAGIQEDKYRIFKNVLGGK
jgi:hypothetical protein